ncbi:MAG TPA: hypothetical protein VJ847_07840 [Gemmatimonadales bacterium]|jgi:hypothetical protein|nr:hypothetical protein [Gemmatimonadales bacterium]
MRPERAARRLLLVLGLVAAGGLRRTAPLDAQTVMPPIVELTGGAMRYTLGARRDGALAALRLASPIVPLGRNHWLVEGGAGYAWYRAADGDLRHLFVPELQLQLQVGPRAVQPYVGAGGGLALTRVDSTTTTKLTASAAVGVRLYAGGWGIGGEIRFRSRTVFDQSPRELTISLFRQLE